MPQNPQRGHGQRHHRPAELAQALVGKRVNLLDRAPPYMRKRKQHQPFQYRGQTCRTKQVLHGGSAVGFHVLQERIIAVQHDHALTIGERLAVSLEAAMERIEGRVLAGGGAVQTCGLGITFAA